RLPVFEQRADVLVVVIDVGQLAAEVDGAVQLAYLGIAGGKDEHRLLAQEVVAGGEVLEGFLEIALGEPPVVARLETDAEVEQGLAVMARVAADGLKLLDRLIDLAGAYEPQAQLEAG